MYVIVVTHGGMVEKAVLCRDEAEALKVLPAHMTEGMELECEDELPERLTDCCGNEITIAAVTEADPSQYSFLVRADIADVREEGDLESDEEAKAWLERVDAKMTQNLEANCLPDEITFYLSKGIGMEPDEDGDE